MADQAQRPAFKINPGDAWLFPNARRDNTLVFQGHFRLEGETVWQAIATLNTDTKQFDVIVREFGTWKEITKFTCPMIGDQPFVETKLKMPLAEPETIDTPDGKLTLTHRNYLVRFYRDTKRPNVLRWTFPAIKRGAMAGNDIPM